MPTSDGDRTSRDFTPQAPPSLGDSVAGDKIAGDKIITGDISATAVAIGAGAQVIYQSIERSVAELAAEARAAEQQRLAQGLTAYVERLRQQAGRAGGGGSPYKALLAYDIQDAALFYGRSTAISQCLDHIAAGSLTVLHAESGAGKTSLLKAGILPRLLAAGHVPLYLRPYATPVPLATKAALLPGLETAPGLAAASLADFLAAAVALLEGRTLVILVDQGEEIFAVQRPTDRAQFVGELAACLDNPALPVRWVLALRGEWLSQLGTFRPQIRNPFANEMLLQALHRDEARQVVVQPARQQGVAWQPTLVDQVIADLGGEPIAPPQLQLVCTSLFEMAAGTGEITQAVYDTAGGASGILTGHLERVLDRDVPPERRNAARLLLQALVTSKRQRALRTHDELVSDLRGQGVDSETTDAVLGQLVDSFLVRVDEIGDRRDVIGYELAHDYLLGEVDLDEAGQARKAAQELLAREVEDYKRHGTLLSPDKLAIVEAQQATLVLGADEGALIHKSRSRIARQRRGVLISAGMIGLLAVSAAASVVLLIAAQAARDEAIDLKETAVAQQVAAERVSQGMFERTGVAPVGGEPADLAWDGSLVWVASQTNQALGVVLALDPRTGREVARHPTSLYTEDLAPREHAVWAIGSDSAREIAQFTEQGRGDEVRLPVGHEPQDFVFSPDHLWVLAFVLNAGYVVDQVDPASGEVVASIPLPQDVYPGGLSWHDGALWIGDNAGQSLLRLDSGTHNVQRTNLRFGPSALVWAGSELWAIDNAGDVVRHVDPATGAVLSSVAVDDGPSGILWDGASLWVSNSGADTVQQIDPSSNQVVATLRTGHQPGPVVWDGSDVWAGNRGDDSVQRLRTEDAAILATRAVAPEPRALLTDRKGLWVASLRWIDLIDPKTLRSLGGFPIDAIPASLAADGLSLWIVDAYHNQVLRVAPQDGALQAQQPLGETPPDGEDLSRLIRYPAALAWADGQLWVTNGLHATVDLVAQKEIDAAASIPVTGYPSAMIGLGEHLWVANVSNNTVQQLDPGAGQVVATYALGAPNPEFDLRLSYPVALASDGRDVWVASSGLYTSTLHRIDTGSGELAPPIEMQGQVRALAWDNGVLWVTTAGGANAVHLVDPVSGRSLAVVPAPAEPTALASAGTALWVANHLGTIQAINAPSLRLLAEARSAAYHSETPRETP